MELENEFRLLHNLEPLPQTDSDKEEDNEELNDPYDDPKYDSTYGNRSNNDRL